MLTRLTRARRAVRRTDSKSNISIAWAAGIACAYLSAVPSQFKLGSSSARFLPEKHVLLLDDPSAHVDTLKSHFAKFNHGQRYRVYMASNAAEAAAALKHGRPDLILLDPQMKGLKGLTLLKQVRALDSSIPVIVVTGKQPLGAVVEVLHAGVFAYVPKPCDFQQLEHLVALVFATPSKTAS